MAQQHLKNSTHKVNEIFQGAIAEAVNAQVRILVPEFVLFALLEQKDSVFYAISSELKIDEVAARSAIVNGIFDFTTNLHKVQQQNAGAATQGNPATEGLYGSQELGALLDKADTERKNFGDAYISSSTLFLAFFDPRIGVARDLLLKAGFSQEEVRKSLSQVRGNKPILSRDDEAKKSMLSQYTRDITAVARRGQLDPVAKREEEIERVIQILSRRKKNNPVLIGEPGVGKTVIIEGLAQRIAQSEVPEHLVGKRILSLEMADLVAGAKMHGEFEERLKGIQEEVIALEGEVILFIDEIHTVVGAGRTSGALDASNILKSALAKGQLQCVGATTFREYKQFIETDRAFGVPVQPVKVEEPTPANAKTILLSLRDKYELHHKIKYSDDALEAAVDLSQRYIFGRSLPDKAIDLMDEAGALKRIQVVSLPPELQKLEKEKLNKAERRQEFFKGQDFAKVAEIQMEMIELEARLTSKRREWESSIRPEDKVVHRDDIAALVSRTTGIPVQRLQAEDLAKLAHIETDLQRRVVGQEKALHSVGNALRRNRVGLRERRAPIGSFLFLGPTGVGKTELAKALAELLLDDESRLIRVDMSEYMERHEAAKLIGSPPGYVGYGEGGQLTEKVRRQPYTVLLFDEVEKAHPDTFHLFLQILDDGRLTDASGEVVNFENTIIVFTSNIGSEHMSSNRRSVGLSAGSLTLSENEIDALVKDELKKVFKPEFLNRLDDIIVFHKLSLEDVEKIFALQEKRLRNRLSTHLGLELDLSPAAREGLIQKGYDPIYGARPLRRVIETELENLIAQEVIRVGRNKETGQTNGSLLVVDRDREHVGFGLTVKIR